MSRLLLHVFTPLLLSQRGAELGTWQPNNHALLAELHTRPSFLVLQVSEDKSHIKYLTLRVTHFSSLAPEGRSVRASGLPRAGNQGQCSWESKQALLAVAARPRASDFFENIRPR